MENTDVLQFFWMTAYRNFIWLFAIFTETEYEEACNNIPANSSQFLFLQRTWWRQGSTEWQRCWRVQQIQKGSHWKSRSSSQILNAGSRTRHGWQASSKHPLSTEPWKSPLDRPGQFQRSGEELDINVTTFFSSTDALDNKLHSLASWLIFYFLRDWSKKASIRKEKFL